MNANRLLSHFQKISDAPDAVDRLRSLVLSLAYAGKLLRGVGTAAAKWQESTVGEVAAEIVPGIACSKSHQTPKGHVHLRTHNIATNGRLNFDLVIRVDPKKLALEKSGLRRGDVIFNNTNSQELVGKTCLVDQDYAYAFSNHLTRIRLKEQVAPEFFTGYFLLLLRKGFFAALCNRWIGQAGINTTALKAIAFAFPPLAEQHRIVAKVDELMRLCDRLEASQKERESRRDRLVVASLNRLSQPTDPDEFKKDAGFQLTNLNRLSTKPEHIKELRKAILNLAVRGRLTSKKSPAEDLPPDWSWSTVEAVGEVKLGRQRSPKDHHGPHMVPYLRVANVYDGYLSLSDVKAMNFTPEEQEVFRLRPGDVLLNEGQSRELVGRPAIYRGEIEGCCFQNTLLRFRCGPSVTSDYALLVFRSYLHCGRFQQAATQTTNMAHLSASRLKAIEFPLPPLAEQKRIVAKVDELMLICDQLETHLEYQQKGRRQLLEALLHEALEGVG